MRIEFENYINVVAKVVQVRKLCQKSRSLFHFLRKFFTETGSGYIKRTVSTLYCIILLNVVHWMATTMNETA